MPFLVPPSSTTQLENSNLPVSSNLLINTSPNAVIDVNTPPCLANALRLWICVSSVRLFNDSVWEGGGRMMDSAHSEIITIAIHG